MSTAATTVANSRVLIEWERGEEVGSQRLAKNWPAPKLTAAVPTFEASV